jgi:ribonucleotide reductase alpha subunit
MFLSQIKDGRKIRVFTLSESFINNFKNKQPDWGFNGLGYFVYKRTYARQLENKSTEEFWQTCKRVVEGVYTIQKQHCKSLSLPWDDRKAQNSAQEMFTRMWEFKFLPPGRGLWAMGTDLIYKKGSAALNNCAFVTTANLDRDFAGPFLFLMDMSMYGVGVGGDCRGAGKIKLQPMIHDAVETYTVGDSREGWVAAVKIILDATSGKSKVPNFNYSQIRPKGALIKGFGGIASGPGPLKSLIESLINLLQVILSLPRQGWITNRSLIRLLPTESQASFG